MLKIYLTFLIIFFLLTPNAGAIYDPLFLPNNKFGIHIIDENDLVSAAHLVNSSGGDWGYVTMVITQEDRKLNKWTTNFELMTKLHLTPIIRIATALSGSMWKTPSISEIDIWADFLDELPWPVKNRYVIIYNEPNHAKEWGGKIDPEGYAEILGIFSQKLKEKSEDFFILPAGIDASAPDSRETMDEVQFIKRMLASKPDIIEKIDGWTSHSYPNPNFKGKVTDQGRGTIANYVWEVELLKTFGIEKRLPVFISETGWPHNQNNPLNSNLLTPDDVAENIQKADEQIWQDKNIVLVSPFLLNYQSVLFANFSWKKMNSEDFYPQYDAYRSIAKTKGQPVLAQKSPTVGPKVDFGNIKGETAQNINKNTNLLLSVWSFLKKFFT